MIDADDMPTLVGLHLAKTGGSTLHGHVKATAPDAYYVCGQHEDAVRVMHGERLLAEYSREERRRLRFLFGHGLTLDDAFLIEADKLRLFVVLRDPFERFVSQYKHYLRKRTDSGAAKTASAFLDEMIPDPTATMIVSSLGRLVGADTTVDTATVTAILAGLDYVLWTSRLDDEGSALMAAIGLPPLTERKRVYPEKPDLDGVTPEKVAARFPVDAAIADVVRREQGALLGNPFGHDSVARERARAMIARSGEAVARAAYFDAFDYLGRNAKLPAGRQAIAANGSVVARHWLEVYSDERGIDPAAAPSVKEAVNLAAEMIDRKQYRSAAEMLEPLIVALPNDFLAHLHLARSLKRIDPQRAREVVLRAMELNPTNSHAKSLFRRLSSRTG